MPPLHLPTPCSCCRNTANSDAHDTGAEACSSVDFVDCPFLGHRRAPGGVRVLVGFPGAAGQAARGADAGRSPAAATETAGGGGVGVPPLAPRTNSTTLAARLCCRHYEPVRELFRTTLGQVYLARNKESKQEVVIKMIERGPAVSKHVESELLIHRCAARSSWRACSPGRATCGRGWGLQHCRQAGGEPSKQAGTSVSVQQLAGRQGSSRHLAARTSSCRCDSPACAATGSLAQEAHPAAACLPACCFLASLAGSARGTQILCS